VPKDLEDNVKIIAGNPEDVVDQLRELGHLNLYIDGGITIQSFLEADLIEEMIITRVPVLLGNGIPLFGRLTKRLHFKHKKTEVLNDMLVKSYYRRIQK
jgi:dihydrofolate reductase